MKSKAWFVALSVLVGLILITGACSAGFIAGRFLTPATSNPSTLLPNLEANTQNSTDPSAATPQDLEKLFKPFWQAWDLVHEKYVDQPVDNELLMQGAIRGMMDALGDQHTSYLDPAQFEISNAHLQGEEYEGIGAWVDISGDYLTIISPMPGSPAEEAGLKPDDKVIAINGEDMTGIDGELVRQKVIGPVGTTVMLTILRSGTEPFDVEVRRASITVPSLDSRMLDSNIAYVQLFTFGDTTTTDLRNALKELPGHSHRCGFAIHRRRRGDVRTVRRRFQGDLQCPQRWVGYRHPHGRPDQWRQRFCFGNCRRRHSGPRPGFAGWRNILWERLGSRIYSACE
jgi:carboxyl-terminal processing protease